jgi:hypothetical protein
MPIVALFSLTFLALTLSHFVLTAKGSQYATEVSTSFALTLFVGLEFLMGIFALSWTLVILLLLTPLMVYEALRPSSSGIVWPELLETDEDDVLLFSHGDVYAALGALAITGISARTENQQQNDGNGGQDKRLYPLWEEARSADVTFTLEVRIEKGMADAFLFISCRDKRWKLAIERAQHARQVAVSWLRRIKHEYEMLDKGQLRQVYSELDLGEIHASDRSNVAQSEHGYLGVLSIEEVPDSENELGMLLEQMNEANVAGRVQISFTSGQIPRIGRNVNGAPQEHSRIPYRVEEHQMRGVYKQIAEVEACEDTGSFKTSISVIIQADSSEKVEQSLRRIAAIAKGVWAGTRITSIRNLQSRWSGLMLRSPCLNASPVSGAKLQILLDFSTPLPGLPRRTMHAEFMLPKHTSLSSDSIPVGLVIHKDQQTSQPYGIRANSLCFHSLVVGNTGSGKTNTAQLITYETYMKGIPFLVISPSKMEWRELGDLVLELRIFTAGNEATAPFRFNFFEVPPRVSIHTHINNITTCFVASWPTGGILADHIAKVFRRTYALAGWDTLNNIRGRPILLNDLNDALTEVLDEMEYGPRMNQDFVGALKSRFETLLDDKVLAVMFNVEKGFTVPELLNHPTVLELRCLPLEQRALLTSLVMVGVSEYLDAQVGASDEQLKHLLVLEEAHHVLKRANSGTSMHEGHAIQQQAINTIVQLLREARGLGLGVVIVDQLPGELSEAAVKLPGITIIHSLKDARERAVVGGQANLTEEQVFYIGIMKRGEAIVHQGFSGEAVNIQVIHFRNNLPKDRRLWTDNLVSEVMRPFYDVNRHFLAQRLPLINNWRSDPLVLWNLKEITEREWFAAKYQEHLAESQESADDYVRKIVGGSIEVYDPVEVKRYADYLIDYLRRRNNEGEMDRGD